MLLSLNLIPGAVLAAPGTTVGLMDLPVSWLARLAPFMFLGVLTFIGIALLLFCILAFIDLGKCIDELRKDRATLTSSGLQGWKNNTVTGEIISAAKKSVVQAEGLIAEKRQPYSNLLERCKTLQRISLPIGVAVCAIKLASALPAIASAPIGHTASLIGTAYVGMIVSALMYVLAILLERALLPRIERMEDEMLYIFKLTREQLSLMAAMRQRAALEKEDGNRGA